VIKMVSRHDLLTVFKELLDMLFRFGVMVRSISEIYLCKVTIFG
jgi:hypothetical protein